MPFHQILPPASAIMAHADAAQATRDEQHLSLAELLTDECMRLYRKVSRVYRYQFPDDSRRDSLSFIEELIYIFTDCAISHAQVELFDMLCKTELHTLTKSTNYECFHAFCLKIKGICSGEIQFDLNRFKHEDWMVYTRDTGPWALDIQAHAKRPGFHEYWQREMMDVWNRISNLTGHYDYEYRGDVDEMNVQQWLERQAAEQTGAQLSEETPAYISEHAESGEHMKVESLETTQSPFAASAPTRATHDQQTIYDVPSSSSSGRERQPSPSEALLVRSTPHHQDVLVARRPDNPPPQGKKPIDGTPLIVPPFGNPPVPTKTDAIEATKATSGSQPVTDGLLTLVPDHIKGEERLAMRMLTAAEGMVNPYGPCECCQKQIQQALAKPTLHTKRLEFIPNGQCRVLQQRKFYRYMRCSACTTAHGKKGVLACNIANPVEKQVSKVEAVWTWKHKIDKGVPEPLPKNYKGPPQPPAEVSREERERMLARPKLLHEDYERVWKAALAVCNGNDMQARRYTADLPFLITREEIEGAINDMSGFIQRAAARDGLADQFLEVCLEDSRSASMSATSSQEQTVVEASMSTSGFTPINMHRHRAALAASSPDVDEEDDEDEEPRAAGSRRKRARAAATAKGQPAQKRQCPN